MNRQRYILKSAGLAILAVLAAGFPGRGAQAAEDWIAGPLFARFSLTLATGEKTEAAGPFYYHQREDESVTFAVPPLFSWTESDATESEEFDLAYPFLTYDRFGTEFRWQLFQLLSFSGGSDQKEATARRFTLFPLYFQQRAEDPTKNYTALFPIYGNLQNRIFRSEISFAMWPLYVKTVRRASASAVPDDPFLKLGYRYYSARRGDVTTYNYFYPFFHLRYGNGLQGWQFWPIAGSEERQVTQSTNVWGDTISTPGHKKRFVLWPFWFDQHREIGGENPEHHQVFVPFYSVLRSPRRDSTSYLWPLGVTVTDDRARNYREVDAPWPFIVFARGEGKTANRVWPFFGQAANSNLVSNFYLWPLYKYNRMHSAPLDRERTRILLFLYSDVSEKNTETGKARERHDFWPLYVHRRDFNGSTRLQILAPVEPILPLNESIERNYSPLWSLWRAERNPETGAASHSFLWNLFRRECTPDTKKCSLLFGLFQYESAPDSRRIRLFYLPLGRHDARRDDEMK